MGGSNHRPTEAELVTACVTCNQRFEADLQIEALIYGWKVKYAGRETQVPVFYAWRGAWGLVDGHGGVRWLSELDAHRRMFKVYGDLWQNWRETRRTRV